MAYTFDESIDFAAARLADCRSSEVLILLGAKAHAKG